MLQEVATKKKLIAAYEKVVGKPIIDRLRKLGNDLKGLRLLEINSTSSGGGVAELLSSVVPLVNSLGIRAEWRLICQDQRFFRITKKIHNALQGMNYRLSSEEKQAYLEHNRRCAGMISGNYDVVVVNDPQPAAILHYLNRKSGKWIWRCHIDTSSANQKVWKFISQYLQEYEATIFTMPEFVPQNSQIPDKNFISPAIDPLNSKNMKLPLGLCQETVSEFGIDLSKPLLLQVSRFDPWKDPLGVIGIYRQVKAKIPDVQLALIGSMANDDPEGWDMYSTITNEIKGDKDIFLFTNLDGVGSLEVNAFQRVSNVIIQKSIREGFGLVVSEALWKKVPVVAGRAGGIKLQMKDDTGGFLIDSLEEASEKVIYLLENPLEAKARANQGFKRVLEKFLITRMLVDKLELIRSLVNKS